MSATTYTISGLSKELVITTRSIRFYEGQGLLSPAREGQKRIYSSHDRTWLKLILRGERLGLTLGKVGPHLLVLDYAGSLHKAGFCLMGDQLSLFTPQGKAMVSLKVPKIDDFLDNNNHNTGQITAPMNGCLIDCLVTYGVSVVAGDALMVVEAMKMEHTIVAPSDGVIGEIYFRVGDLVDADVQLLDLQES